MAKKLTKTPRTDAIQFIIGNRTPLEDAFKCFERLHKVSRELESALIARLMEFDGQRSKK